MVWTLVVVLVLAAIVFQWRQSKNAERANVAKERLERDTRLYRNIKTGMREYHFREREKDFWQAKDGELLFETAHLPAFSVKHFIESRVGFYFKDTEESGSTASSLATTTMLSRAITAPTAPSKRKKCC